MFVANRIFPKDYRSLYVLGFLLGVVTKTYLPIITFNSIMLLRGVQYLKS